MFPFIFVEIILLMIFLHIHAHELFQDSYKEPIRICF